MEDWRATAIAELEQLLELLNEKHFSREDLGDRLREQLNFAELMTGEPFNEESN